MGGWEKFQKKKRKRERRNQVGDREKIKLQKKTAKGGEKIKLQNNTEIRA